jgi:hypothetical protein
MCNNTGFCLVWQQTAFRPFFQVAASKADAEIKIVNEPLDMLPKGSSVFLMEAGEALSLPETPFEWLNRLIESQFYMNV